MLDGRFEQLRRDALTALVGSNDKADDRADVHGTVAWDTFELGLRRGVAPAHDATKAVRDQAVCFGGAQELAAGRAILLLSPRWVVVHEPLHAEAPRPVG